MQHASGTLVALFVKPADSMLPMYWKGSCLPASLLYTIQRSNRVIYSTYLEVIQNYLLKVLRYFSFHAGYSGFIPKSMVMFGMTNLIIQGFFMSVVPKAYYAYAWFWNKTEDQKW